MRGKAFPLGSAKNTTVFVFAIPHSPRGKIAKPKQCLKALFRLFLLKPPKTPRRILL